MISSNNIYAMGLNKHTSSVGFLDYMVISGGRSLCSPKDDKVDNSSNIGV